MPSADELGKEWRQGSWTEHDLSLAGKLVYPAAVQHGDAQGLIYDDVDRSIVEHLGCRTVTPLITAYKTSTQCVMLERQGHYVLTFRGTQELEDFAASAKELLGYCAWQNAWEAVEPVILPVVYENIGNMRSFHVVGHSLGGDIAIIAGNDLHKTVNLSVCAWGPAKMRPSVAARISSMTPIRIYRHPLDAVTYMASPRWRWPVHADVRTVGGWNWNPVKRGLSWKSIAGLPFAHHSIDFYSRQVPQTF
jgi:hypothetical protein